MWWAGHSQVPGGPSGDHVHTFIQHPSDDVIRHRLLLVDEDKTAAAAAAAALRRYKEVTNLTVGFSQCHRGAADSPAVVQLWSRGIYSHTGIITHV